MDLTWNILLDQLRDYSLEVHLSDNLDRKFCRAALLPQDYGAMREDLVHICRLSDAMRACSVKPGMGYICVRNRIKDDRETDECLSGMIIVNENIEIEFLLDRVQEIYQRIADWYSAMQEALIREKSIQDLLDLSESVIGNTINISDSAFTLLASTSHIDTDDEISLTIKNNGYHPEATLARFRKENRYSIWAQAKKLIVNDDLTLSPYVMVNRVFRFRNTYFIHVVMVCDHHPLSDGLLELFSFLTDLLAVYAERNWKDKNAMSHNYDSFLSDLLTGSVSKQEDIAERAKYLGIPVRGRMQVMKLTVPAGSEAALGRIARELGELLPDAQILLYELSVLALLHLRNGLAGLPEDQLSPFLRRHEAKAALSNEFSSLNQLPSAWFQAGLALKYSGDLRGSALVKTLIPIPEQPEIPCFRDRILHSLLGEYDRSQEIWTGSPYYQALHDMWDYDREHGTNNLQLLRVYLWNERKATETAQILHMHRNNVIYRIGRIEDITGLHLSEHGVRLGLEMSFLLLEIFGFPETVQPSE